jgi:hypothetical protein
MLFSSIILLLWFFSTSLSASFPDIQASRLAVRQTSDPCCASCAQVGAVPFNPVVCPPSGDIFCGCKELIQTGPACRACIDDVEARGLNTSYVGLMSLMEYFYSWCQCQNECRPVANAFFGTTCNYGVDAKCVNTALVHQGPDCSKCVRKIDLWFANTLDVYIRGSKAFLATGKVSYPGTYFPHHT